MRSAVSQFIRSPSLFLWRVIMNVVNDRSFEEDRATSSASSSSSENVDEFSVHILQTNEVLGYQFQRRRDSCSSESSVFVSNTESEVEILIPVRLDNLNWQG